MRPVLTPSPIAASVPPSIAAAAELPRGLAGWRQLIVFCVPLLAVGCSGAANPGLPGDPSVKQQVQFGVQMAQRGLWSEALFRFRQAERLAPDSPAVLGNIAVAYEGTGSFDEALAYYKKALAVAPSDRDLKRNYARFIEFYQSFRPGAATPAGGAAGPAAAGTGAPPATPPPPVGDSR